MCQSLLLLPNSGALDRLVLVLPFQLCLLLSLVLGGLPSQGDHMCSRVHGLKDPVNSWLPAQVSPLSSRLPHQTAYLATYPWMRQRPIRTNMSQMKCMASSSPQLPHIHTNTQSHLLQPRLWLVFYLQCPGQCLV